MIVDMGLAHLGSKASKFILYHSYASLLSRHPYRIFLNSYPIKGVFAALFEMFFILLQCFFHNKIVNLTNMFYIFSLQKVGGSKFCKDGETQVSLIFFYQFFLPLEKIHTFL